MALSEVQLLVHSVLSSPRLRALCWREKLLNSNEVPNIQREPWILTSYRPCGRSWSYYLQSFYSFHNETINVWTHSFGFLLILVQLLLYLRGVDVANNKLAWPVLIFGVSCLFQLSGSTLAHLLHSKSTWYHYAFYFVDYLGISIYSFGTGVGSMFICSTRFYYDLFHTWFQTGNVVLSWFAFFAMCEANIRLAHNNSHRKALMIGAVTLDGIYIGLPTLSRYVECFYKPECTFGSLNHLTLVLVLISMCGVIFAAHVPERFMPGCFDVFGHSHQIFHVFVVSAMLSQFRALNIEINVLRNADHFDPNLQDILFSFGILLVLEIFTLVCYIQFIDFHKISELVETSHRLREITKSMRSGERLNALSAHGNTIPSSHSSNKNDSVAEEEFTDEESQENSSKEHPPSDASLKNRSKDGDETWDLLENVPQENNSLEEHVINSEAVSEDSKEVKKIL